MSTGRRRRPRPLPRVVPSAPLRSSRRFCPPPGAPRLRAFEFDVLCPTECRTECRAATHRTVQPARHAEASARARHANLKFNVTGRLQAAVSRRPCPRQSALAGIYTSCLSACPVVLVFTTSGPPHAIKLDQGFNKGT